MSAEDAEAGDIEYYARYLLTRGREQLLAGPLPLLLTDDAGEDQLAAAVRAALDTVATALASIATLRVWREYAFPRAALGARLASQRRTRRRRSRRACHGDQPSRAGRPPPFRRLESGGALHRRRPLLRTISGAPRSWPDSAIPPPYATRTPSLATTHAGKLTMTECCHPARTCASTTAGRAAASGAHRIRPGRTRVSTRSAARPRMDRKPAATGRRAAAQPLAAGANARRRRRATRRPRLWGDLISHRQSLSWTVTLRLAHTITGVAALPDRVAKELPDGRPSRRKASPAAHPRGIQPGPAGCRPGRRRDAVGPRARLTGVEWPLEFFPGIALTFTWQRGADVLRARSTLLEAPVTIDGIEYEHRYDPAVLTRDTAPGCARRGDSDHGPLTLGQRVLRAVRRTGHLDPNGVAVLRRDLLADLVYGRDAGAAGAAALEPVVDAMLADGTLTAAQASVGADGLAWPAAGPGSACRSWCGSRGRSSDSPGRAAGRSRTCPATCGSTRWLHSCADCRKARRRARKSARSTSGCSPATDAAATCHPATRWSTAIPGADEPQIGAECLTRAANCSDSRQPTEQGMGEA